MTAIGMFLAVVLFILGLVGTFLPVLPGAPLIWLGMSIYGILTGFSRLHLPFYLMQGVAVLITFLIDYIATAYGTKRYGGSSAAIWGSIIGALVGPIFLGLPGLIIGPFLGALIGELTKGRPFERAFRSAFGTLIGLAGSLLLKLGIEVLMIIWFFRVALS